MERPQVRPMRKVKRKGVRLLNLHPECLAEVLTEMPFLQSIYEARRHGPPPPLEKPRVETKEFRGFALIGAKPEDPRRAPSHAAHKTPSIVNGSTSNSSRDPAHLREEYGGETVTSWQRRLWSRYSRNLAMTQGQLLGGLFELTIAARSVIDDNMAWEMWEMAGAYPIRKPTRTL